MHIPRNYREQETGGPVSQASHSYSVTTQVLLCKLVGAQAEPVAKTDGIFVEGTDGIAAPT
jgi:hypothetical protein